jgi:hypothetical protein
VYFALLRVFAWAKADKCANLVWLDVDQTRGENVVSDYTTIRINREDRVATLWLHRPEVRNAFSDIMAQEIPQAMTELAIDDDVRAVILTGAGEVAFCAGADLKEMKARPSSGGDITWKRRQRGVMLHSCFQSLRDLPKPIVAAVNGYCLGAGLELMASCDLIIASDRAQFAMPEICRRGPEGRPGESCGAARRSVSTRARPGPEIGEQKSQGHGGAKGHLQPVAG